MIGSPSRKAPLARGVKEEEPLETWQSLSHVKWDCKYHIVIVSKYRNRTIYGELRKKVGGIIRNLCRQKGIEIYGSIRVSQSKMVINFNYRAGKSFVREWAPK